MTTLDFVGTQRPVRPGITMVELSDRLCRITRNTGEVLGYIETVDDASGRRFHAKRLLSAQSRSLPLGDFWSFDDALDCFRL
jgi:hypothetical protein